MIPAWSGSIVVWQELAGCFMYIYAIHCGFAWALQHGESGRAGAESTYQLSFVRFECLASRTEGK